MGERGLRRVRVLGEKDGSGVDFTGETGGLCSGCGRRLRFWMAAATAGSLLSWGQLGMAASNWKCIGWREADAAEKGPAHYSALSENFWDGFASAICKPRLQMDPRVSRRTADPQQCNWVHNEEWDRDMTRRGGGPAHPLQLLESGHDTTKQLHSARASKYITASINHSIMFHQPLGLQPEKGAFPFPLRTPKITQSRCSTAGSNEPLGACSSYAYSTYFQFNKAALSDAMMSLSQRVGHHASDIMPSRCKLATHRLLISPVHNAINNGIKEKSRHRDT